MNTLENAILKEWITKRYEEIFAKERENLIEFIKTYFSNERPKGIANFHVSPFHLVIADTLEKSLQWEYNRVIINIPPGHWKTELITKSFPVWAMWRDPNVQIIATGYSTTLTQWFSAEARDYYNSDTFKKIFPRSPDIKKTQDTKEHRQNEAWGAYYATWFGGSITGKRANIFLIDDPIKPDEADSSNVIRTGVNNLFLNTVASRLFDPAKDVIIIIMQRTHDDDLCWFLIDRMEKGWEKRKVLSMPAIAEVDEIYETKYWLIERKKWEPLDNVRFPVPTLDILKSGMGNTIRSTQYQQEPVNKETQEFHEERYRYYDPENPPKGMRIFTTCDPAFTKNTTSDYTAIVTWWFIGEDLYILEYTQARLDPSELINKLIYHTRKRWPEKIGIEAFQAQTIISHNLAIELEKQGLFTNITDIKQQGDKESKIRKLIYHYRNWHIYHTKNMSELEFELRRFPRGQHDDIIDALQMLYDMYTTMPNTIWNYQMPIINYDSNWIPIIS
jgi:predicted phage terminase large subunit-like protein